MFNQYITFSLFGILRHHRNLSPLSLPTRKHWTMCCAVPPGLWIHVCANRLQRFWWVWFYLVTILSMYPEQSPAMGLWSPKLTNSPGLGFADGGSMRVPQLTLQECFLTFCMPSTIVPDSPKATPSESQPCLIPCHWMWRNLSVQKDMAMVMGSGQSLRYFS